MLIEIAANSLQSALNAQDGGASRIELCSALELGGITPGAGLIRKVRQALDIPVFVLIRPRSGDFIFTDREMEVMLEDVKFCVSEGIDGIVWGGLNADGTIDEDRLKIMKREANGLQFTFHRAFDHCVDPLEGLNTLIKNKIDRLLTSGQASNVVDGRMMIKKLINEAKGRITVMPGCGLNENNIQPIAAFTGATEFHASMKSLVKSQAQFNHKNVLLSSGADIPEHDYFISDRNKIEKLVSALKD